VTFDRTRLLIFLSENVLNKMMRKEETLAMPYHPLHVMRPRRLVSLWQPAASQLLPDS
jgi:hypothetical protein